jgi:phage antirepressor YoqD-like protein
MKKDKKEEAKKKRRNKKDDEKKDEEENTINFHPKIEKCNLFLKEALSMIVGSTNKVCNLEDDLMPFL